MEVFGVPIQIVHALVVEEHSGIVVFVMLALVVRILTDLFARSPTPSSRVQSIRQGSDVIGYAGSFAAVIFLILSGITGYLIQPYSLLITSPILVNKSLTALAALFFWLAYFLVRFWAGPGLWQKRGLYAVQIITALLGTFFTALAGSIGAELSLGQSALEPMYKMLGFSWKTFLVTPLDVELTVGLVVVGVLVAFFFPSQKTKPT